VGRRLRFPEPSRRLRLYERTKQHSRDRPMIRATSELVDLAPAHTSTRGHCRGNQ
jgi:hypothetical protein